MAKNEKEQQKATEVAAPEVKPKARKPFSFDQLQGSGNKLRPQPPKMLRSRITRGSNRGR